MRTSAAPGGPSDGGESNLTPGPSQPTVGPVPGTAQGAPAETPLYKVLFGCWADLGFGETLRVVRALGARVAMPGPLIPPVHTPPGDTWRPPDPLPPPLPPHPWIFVRARLAPGGVPLARVV
jgi:hypothetical protein